MVLGNRLLFYLELSHYRYWGLFKGKGSTGNRLLYDHIGFGWREMRAEIFRRQRGSTCISGAAPFWTSLVPRCSVLGARLFGGSLVRTVSRLHNNICACELWTSKLTHWRLAKLQVRSAPIPKLNFPFKCFSMLQKVAVYTDSWILWLLPCVTFASWPFNNKTAHTKSRFSSLLGSSLLMPGRSFSWSFFSSCRSVLPLLFWHLADVICLCLPIIGSAGPPLLWRVTTKRLTMS